jgi:hypothetical protein
VFQLNGEGTHNACFHVREDFVAGASRPASVDLQKTARSDCQILNRFVEARVKRSWHEEKDIMAPRRQKPAD